MSVLVVGSVALDSIENMYGKKDDILGGSASFASYASSFFSTTNIVGIVGDDFPQKYLDLFASKNIDVEGLHRAEGKTFRWGGKYRHDMVHRDTLFTELGVFDKFNPVLPESYKNSEYVLLANIQPELQLQVLNQMSQPDLVATDTMNLWINTVLEELHEVIRRSDMLFLNDEEARQLTGKVNLTEAAEALMDMGPKTVIIKRGEHGASLHTDNDYFFVPSYPVARVFDTTGAGDTFAGAMLGYLATCKNIDKNALRLSMVLGTVLASFTVEDFSLDALAKIEEHSIKERVEAIRKSVLFDEYM